MAAVGLMADDMAPRIAVALSSLRVAAAKLNEVDARGGYSSRGLTASYLAGVLESAAAYRGIVMLVCAMLAAMAAWEFFLGSPAMALPAYGQGSR